MPLLSQVVGRPVLDVNGHRVGRLIDLVACVGGDAPYPEVQSLVVKRARTAWFVPFSAVVLLDAPAIPLNRVLYPRQAPRPQPDGLRLVRDVLGRQLLDKTSGTVLRVSDLGLLQVRSRLWVTVVHTGGRRTLGRPRSCALRRWVATWQRRKPGERAIRWGDVEWVSENPGPPAEPISGEGAPL